MIKIVCPNCLKTNRIPKKESYKKANCGSCKHSLLDTKPKDVDDNAFRKHIANNDIVVVVDFWARWCGPCMMFSPTYESVASKLPLKARLIKVDTEQNGTTPSQFDIQGIPTIIIFKGGKEVDRISGALGEDQFFSWISRYI